MEVLLSAGEMRACDARTIRYFGVPGEVLMERAALACADALGAQENGFDLSRILVVCGGGNNGGDGFATARILRERGYAPDLLFIGDMEKRTEQTAAQMEICRKYGLKTGINFDPAAYTVIVDAIFGVGLSREITGSCGEWIGRMNASSAKVLSVDIPSGISADTGQILGCAVRADVTVTFAFRKIGHLLYPGRAYAGRVVTAQIGIAGESLAESPGTFAVGPEVFRYLPGRTADSHKGTYGKALIAAGSRNMSGAACLCAAAAYRTGTGLVRVLTEECNRPIVQTLLPEAVLTTLRTEAESGELLLADAEQTDKAAAWADAVCAGPGLGRAPWKSAFLKRLLAKSRGPLVLDADALNILSEEPGLLKDTKGPVIVTPHVGEMARLNGLLPREIAADPVGTAKRFAARHGVICVLKGAATVVSDGARAWINETGNHGMAAGGSGDVLAGIITGFLAQGAEPLPAALLGVYVHGKAGDAAMARCGARGMLAGDTAASVADVLKGF